MFSVRKDVMLYNYYLYSRETKERVTEDEVAKVVELPTEEVIVKLSKDYNAQFENRMSPFVFASEEEAKGACGYLNSILVLKKLTS